MEKQLTKVANELYYYNSKNKKVLGENGEIYGDCSRLRGDCSRLRGDCSGLSGDLDDCEITDENQKAGVNIKDLIK